MIYLRILGAAAVSVCAALLGMGHTRSRRQTAAVVTDLAAALRSMADEVAALQTPIPQMLHRFAQSSRLSAGFFDACIEKMHTMSLGEAWCEACSSLSFNEEEKNAVSFLSREIGRLDAAAQSAQLRLAAGRLEESSGLRMELLRREGKTPAALGACLGIMCAIVLF